MSRSRILASLFLVATLAHVTWAIVGGVHSKAPEPDEPVLFTRSARVEGLRKDSNGLYSFLGISYGKVQKRFTRPQYHPLLGDVTAIFHGPPCAQPDAQNNTMIIGVEDCLTLSVHTPQMPDGETALPVIVWIHGGGFRYGSAAQYGPDPLTDQRVVLVAIQYRLGSLGILGSGRREFPGNLALLDGAMAIRWVSEHIEAFGGDAKNIKVMGHGSGAAFAMHLSASPLSKSSIAGVIAMSGSVLSRHSIEEAPVETVDQVAEMNGCTGKSDDPKIIIGCLRGRKFQDLIKVDNKLEAKRFEQRGPESGLTGFVNFNPHVEMKDDDRGLPGFLTESPKEKVENQHLPKVPLLIGVTKQETAKGLNLKNIKRSLGSYENFLKALTAPAKLKELTSTITRPLNALPVQLPDVNQYLAIPENLNPLAIVARLTEISTDVLFNLPATLIADAWSKAAPSFMYQFDYAGKHTVKGSELLKGLPLVSDGEDGDAAAAVQDSSPPVAHGDELAFLFDLADINGKPLGNKQMTAEEKQVRGRFTQVIKEFAMYNHNGTKSELFKKPFSSKGSSFIQINDQLNVKSDFRFCALSLWGASVESSSGQKDCMAGLPILSSLPVSVPNIPLLKKNTTVGNVVGKLGNTGFLGFG